MRRSREPGVESGDGTDANAAPAPLNVLVLGMHRSGTSAVAEALRSAGFDAGDESNLMDPEPQNPLGFGERLDVALYNDRLLASLEWFWDAPDPAPYADPPARPALVAEGRTLIQDNLVGPRPFILKDPRISLLLPWWREILLDRFVPVVVMRPPAEVAWSLKVRDGFPIELGLALWAAYHRHIAAGLNGMQWIGVDFEFLCNKPQATVNGLIKSLHTLGVEADVDSRAGARKIRPLLRRATQPRDVSIDSAAIAAIRDIREQWPKEGVAVRDTFQPSLEPPSDWERAILASHRRTREAKAREDAVRSSLSQQEQQFAALSTRHADLERVASELRSEGTALHEQINAASRERDSARASLTQLESRFAALNEQQRNLQGQVTTLGDQKQERERAAAELSSQLEGTARERDAARAQIASAETALAALARDKAEVERDAAALRQGIEDVTRDRDAARTGVTRLERHLAKQRADAAALRRQIKDVGRERDTAQAKLSELDERIRTLAIQRDKLEVAGTESDVADRERAGIRSGLSALQADLAQLTGDRASLEDHLTALSVERDRLERAVEELRQQLNDVSGERDAARTSLGEMAIHFASLNAQGPGQSATLAELRSQLDEAVIEREAARTSLGRVVNDFAEINAKHSDLAARATSLREQLDAAEFERDSARLSLGEAETRLSVLGGQHAELTQALDALQRQLEQATTDRDSAQGEQAALETRLAALREQQTDLEHVAADLREHLTDAHHERDAVKSNLDAVQAQLDTTRTHRAQLERTTIDLRHRVRDAAVEQETLRSRLADLGDRFAALGADRAQLDQAVAELRERVFRVNTERDTARASLTEAEGRLAIVRRERAELEHLAAGQRQQLDEMTQDRVATRNSMAQTEARFASLAADRAQLDRSVTELMSERDRIRRRVATIESEREDAQARVRSLGAQLTSLDAERADLEQVAIELRGGIATMRQVAEAAGRERDTSRERQAEVEALLASTTEQKIALDSAVGQLRSDGAALREQIEQLGLARDQLSSERDELHGQLAQLMEQNSRLITERADLESVKEESDRDRQELIRRIAETDERLGREQVALEAMLAERSELEARLEAATARRGALSVVAAKGRVVLRSIRHAYRRAIVHLPQTMIGLVWHNPLFDAGWYLEQYPDVRQKRMRPELHFRRHGVPEARRPNPYFETGWYLEHNPDVARTGLNPLDHYLMFGAAEGRDPSGWFDTEAYLTAYPDVAASKMNPLLHYLRHGLADGRQPTPVLAAPAEAVSPAPHQPSEPPSPTQATMSSGTAPAVESSGAQTLTTTSVEEPAMDAQNVSVPGVDPATIKVPPVISPPHIQPSSSATQAQVSVQPVPPEPMADDVRVIAFYRAAYYHEETEPGGHGPSEWMTVAKARPLIPGQRQPHVPGELGFYDLRLAETRREQAELARAYGIHAFCYEAYWGHPDLHMRPFREMLATGEPDFPFTLRISIIPPAPLKPSTTTLTTKFLKTNQRQLAAALEALRDRRAVTVGKRSMLLVDGLDPVEGRGASDAIRREAKRLRLQTPFIVAPVTVESGITEASELGVDALLAVHPDPMLADQTDGGSHRAPSSNLTLVNFGEYSRNSRLVQTRPDWFETVVCGWDETPLNGNGKLVLTEATPEAYGQWLRAAVSTARDLHARDQRFVFVASWNDWAHGSHLEPDILDGRTYLQITRSSLVPPVWATSEPL